MAKDPSVSIVWWLDAKAVQKIREDDVTFERDPTKMDLILDKLQEYDNGGDIDVLREDIKNIINA